MSMAVPNGQRWPDLPVAALGQWTPFQRVAVILPARDNQAELDRTLATLAHQSYPKDLLEVLVVDDSSEPALTLPQVTPPATRVLRRSEMQSHGSGAARDAGARASTAEILLFLDSDMLADPRHVEAHARWHHVTDEAVVLGRKWFVAVDDITPGQLDREARQGHHVGDLLSDRRQGLHGWQEELIESHDGLSRDEDDAFLAVVGATVSISRRLYERCGGFAAFGLRGIVDTEFGYRAFTRGGILIPDAEATCWHQGARNFATRGGEIKRARAGLAANHLPIPLFRQQNTGRSWIVPMVRVLVDVSVLSGADGYTEDVLDRLLLTLDSALSSDVTDLAVTVITGRNPLPSWFVDYYAAEGRVQIEQANPGTGFPSPVTIALPPAVVLAPTTVSAALSLLSPDIRVIRTLPEPGGPSSVEFWRTRTLERALHHGLDQMPATALGERWSPADALGISLANPQITKQGMVTQHC